MSERLRHLQRQRALLSEHLTWIDNEIARENQIQSAASIEVASKESPTPPPPQSVTAATAPAEADALIEKYAADERQNPDDIRRGCLYVFISALILLIAGVTAVWLLFYR